MKQDKVPGKGYRNQKVCIDIQDEQDGTSEKNSLKRVLFSYAVAMTSASARGTPLKIELTIDD